MANTYTKLQREHFPWFLGSPPNRPNIIFG